MKKGSFRHIKFKTRKTCRKDLKKECDKLWSEVVLLRDGRKCRYCGRPGNNPHHIFSRKYTNTRHNPDAGITLCWACHFHVAHGEPEKFRDFVMQKIGAELFEKLKISAHMTGIKMDMAGVKLMLEKEKAAYTVTKEPSLEAAR